MQFARIAGDKVAELITAESPAELAERFHPDLVASMVPAAEGIGEGWIWNGTTFAAPPPPPAPVRRLSALAFRRRLSPSRRAVITLAASQAMEGGDATLQVWLDDLAAAGFVDLDHPETAGGVAAMLAAEIITEAERDALLANPQPEEL